MDKDQPGTMDQPSDMHNLGLMLYQRGDLVQAEALIRGAIAQNDQIAAYHCNHGVVLQALSRLDEALHAYDQALRLQPNYAEAHYNRGFVLQAFGRMQEALLAYDQALRIDPNDAEAHNNRGNALKELGHLDEALLAYDQALRLKPDFAEAHGNCGSVLKYLGRLEDALLAYDKALRLKPDSAEIHTNRGNVLRDLGRLEEALLAYDQALQLRPDFAETYSNILLLFAYDQSLWLKLEPAVMRSSHRSLRSGVETTEDAAMLFLARSYGNRLPRTLPPLEHPLTPVVGRRLRVGYVSGDFRCHPIAYFIEALFAQHDRTRIEVLAYSTNWQQDAVTARIRKLVDRWQSIVGLSDEAAAARIRDDEIDVLIDLSGYTAHNRLGVFAQRAAPVQAHYLGCMGSTGLPEMNYWIGDRVLTPATQAEHFSETLWQLPRVWVSYTADPSAPEPCWQTRHDNQLWLGSFNTLRKLTPGTVALWSRVLHALPQASLLLKAKELAVVKNRTRVIDAFQQQGIPAERLALQDSQATPSWAAHMAYYERLDLALDPVGPVCGGTTTCDALWMGVPVITKRGKRMSARMSASMLTALDREEWIAEDDEAYIAKVVALAGDVAARRAVRFTQRERMRHSPLCDAQGLARALEDAYTAMYERWLDGKNKPATKNPDTLDRRYHQALAAHQSGDLETAQAGYRDLLAQYPDHADAAYSLGLVMYQRGDLIQAEALIRRAITKNGQIAAYHCHHGVVLKALSRLDAALHAYDAAVRLEPDHAEAHYNRGIALHNLGHLDEALHAFDQVLRFVPNDAEAHNNRGIVLHDLGRSKEALHAYDQALRLQPDFAKAHNNRGIALGALARTEDALHAIDQALRLKLDSAEVHSNRGNALKELGLLDDALLAYDRAVQLKPESADVRSKHLFALSGWEAGNDTALLALARDYGSRFPRTLPPLAHPPVPVAGRRLRVGYVSGDFYSHVVAYFFEALLARHNHERIEVLAYTTNAKQDDVTARIRKQVDRWQSIVGLSDEAAAARIRDDQVDVLVDLSNHTAHNRLGVFAQRAAPVQVHYLGHFMTTGVAEIDYWIGDAEQTPSRMDECYSETLWRLPRVSHAYNGVETAPTPAWPPHGDGAIWLGCFHNMGKITPKTIYLWSQVLHALPNAKLRLKETQLGAAGRRERLTADFAACGIGADRLELCDRTTTPDWASHLRAYDGIDIALDPIGPWRGAATTCDALWMGVPVITLRGERPGSRLTSSLLLALGREEWIAEDDEAYIAKVVALAGDVAARRAMRLTQRERMRHSPLCDAQGLARALEDAYTAMYERWLDGKNKPATNTPDTLDRRYHQALAAHQSGDLETAQAGYRDLLAQHPDHADAMQGLGLILYQRGDLVQAEALIRRAITKNDQIAAYHCNHGAVLTGLSSLDAALHAFDQALRLKPDYALAHNNRGDVLNALGRSEEALFACDQALQLQPDYAEAHSNRGNALSDLGRLEGALLAYDQAVRFRPNHPGMCSNHLFALSGVEAGDDTALLALARDYASRFPRTLPPFEREMVPVTGRRLRVGYVSGDFRRHPVAYFLETLLTQHDRTRLEVLAYTTNAQQDAVTARIRKRVDHWQSIVGLSDEAAAARIRDDRVDVLVDLSNHSAHNRLGVFAQRAAPVQVHYLGHFMTTGVAEIDYWIGDAEQTPSRMDECYSETLWRLPRISHAYSSTETALTPAWQPQEDGSVWLGCFHNPIKITPRTITLWARVLQALPNARLRLKAKPFSSAERRERLTADFAACGIGADRLELCDNATTPDWASHLRAYDGIDIALDPIGPWRGAATTCDALWMGVPVITLRGERPGSRLTSSLLLALGRAEWIAEDDEAYIARVVALAGDVAARRAMRLTQRERMRHSPLCDAQGLARALEDAYTAMYERWLDGKNKPATNTPDTLDRRYQQALAAHQSGDLETAQAGYRDLLAQHPDHADAMQGLGLILYQRGDLVQAETLIRCAIANNDQIAAYHCNHGAVLKALSRLDEALHACDQALRLKPDYALAHNNRGDVLYALGRSEEALFACDQALRLRPNYAEAHSNRGNALNELGRSEDALLAYDQALQLQPDSAEMHSNRGNALSALGRAEEALLAFDEALRLNPNDAVAHCQRGIALDFLGRPEDALLAYDQAVQLKPNHPDLCSNHLFALSVLEAGDDTALLALARDYASRFPRTLPPLAHPPVPAAGRRLRVGYVSGDFRRHAVASFLETLLTQHDRTRLEVLAYTTNAQQDAVTARIRKRVDHWQSIVGLSDEAAAARIRDDQVDVLIDLSGHTVHNRLGVFAQRAAPVQAHYLGFMGSTGVPEIDYWIGDRVITPATQAQHFSETLWQLPRVWVSYTADPSAPAPSWQTRQDNQLWLGSFNTLRKLTPGTVALWSRVLHALPHAKLLLKTKELSAVSNRKRILEAFQQQGIPAERIALQDSQATPSWTAHMAYYEQLDLALDPVGPVCGGTTTCDALWMGVPVITKRGKRMSARMSASMLTALGREEWIAEDDEAYIAKVVALAGDVAARRAMRLTQRERMRHSPLCDAQGLARALEDAYTAMYERWLDGKNKPATNTPDTLDRRYQQALAAHQSGDLETAQAGYRDLLAQHPNHADTLHSLGLVMYQRGDLVQAETLIRRAIANNDQVAAYHSHHGVILKALSRLDEALHACDQAVRLQPDDAVAHNNRGDVLNALGRSEEALIACDRALQLHSGYAEIHNNRGNALNALERPEEALLAFEQALQLRPEYAEAHSNRGIAFSRLGRSEDALFACDQALKINPDLAEAHSNRGSALNCLGRPEEALFACDQALKIRPDYAEGQMSRGVALSALGRAADALHAYEQALRLKPDYVEARSNHLFLLSAWEAGDEAALLALARDYASRFPRTLPPFEREIVPVTGRRLRVGYVSGDFRCHPVAYFLETLLTQHDRTRLEVLAYTTNAQQDAVTTQIREQVDHWQSIVGLSDEAAAARIRDDQVDVLVDLSNHTGHNRLGVFAQRAAPVQVHYLGHFMTTGVAEIDYWIGDAEQTPSRMDECYSETLWRLPRVSHAYGGVEKAPTPAWQPQKDGRVWLGSFHNPTKITPRTIALWARVLHALPNAQLRLKAKPFSSAERRKRLTADFAAHGIGADRFELCDNATTPDWASHLRAYDGIDIALDPIGPWRGAATTCDALWMGVPVITLRGERPGSRLTSSLLLALGRAEWIAEDDEAYIAKVVALAGDVAARRAMRLTQRERMRHSPLCDTQGLARALEDAYTAMYERWLDGKNKPATLDKQNHQALAAHQSGDLETAQPGTASESNKQPDVLISHHDQAAEAKRPTDDNAAAQRPRQSVRFSEKWQAQKNKKKQRSSRLNPTKNSKQKQKQLPEEKHYLKAVTAHQSGDLETAEAGYRHLLTQSPDHADAMQNLGLILYQRGDLVQAEALIRGAITKNDQIAAYHCNHGVVLKALSRLDEALHAYHVAVRLNPDYAEAHYNLGSILHDTERLEDALRAYDKALTLNPNCTETHSNRGNVLRDLGRSQEALRAYDQALQINPEYVEAHNNRIIALNELGRLEEAESSARQALAAMPNELRLLRQLAATLAARGLTQEAESIFLSTIHHAKRKLVDLFSFHLLLPPINESRHSLLNWRERYVSGLETLESVADSFDDPIIALNVTFCLAYANDPNRPIVEKLARLYRSKAPDLTFSGPHLAAWQAPVGRRIRIGFCSQFLADHTIGKLYQGFIRQLDRKQFEVILIYPPGAKQDSFRHALEKQVGHVIALPRELKAQQTRLAKEKLDVLFYPDIGMSAATYFLAFSRLAPVQVVSWGHPETTGIDTLDYFISSAGIESEAADENYSERLIRMSRLPCYYEPLAVPQHIPERGALGLPDTGTLYGCPQTLFKLHPDFDAVLHALLRDDPSGYLVLLEGRVKHWVTLLRQRWASTAPILNERTIILSQQPLERFMALLAHIDVLLDPIYFGSGNTLYEAMVYGTPIITWPGRFMRGRIVAGAYRQIGVNDAPIVETLDDYAPLAIAFGRDPERRRVFRQNCVAAADRALFADQAAVLELEQFITAAVAAAGRGERLPMGWQPGMSIT